MPSSSSSSTTTPVRARVRQESHRVYLQRFLAPSFKRGGVAGGAGGLLRSPSRRDDDEEPKMVTSSAAVRLTDAATAAEVTHLLRKKFELSDEEENAENDDDHENEETKRRQHKKSSSDAATTRPTRYFAGDALVLVGTLRDLPRRDGDDDGSDPPENVNVVRTLLPTENPLSVRDTMSAHLARRRRRARGRPDDDDDDDEPTVARRDDENNLARARFENMERRLRRRRRRTTTSEPDDDHGNDHDDDDHGDATTTSIRWFFQPNGGGVARTEPKESRAKSPGKRGGSRLLVAPTLLGLDGYTSGMDEEDDYDDDEDEDVKSNEWSPESYHRDTFGVSIPGDDDDDDDVPSSPPYTFDRRAAVHARRRDALARCLNDPVSLVHRPVVVSGPLLRRDRVDPNVWRRVDAVLTDDFLWLVSPRSRRVRVAPLARASVVSRPTGTNVHPLRVVVDHDDDAAHRLCAATDTSRRRWAEAAADRVSHRRSNESVRVAELLAEEEERARARRGDAALRACWEVASDDPYWSALVRVTLLVTRHKEASRRRNGRARWEAAAAVCRSPSLAAVAAADAETVGDAAARATATVREGLRRSYDPRDREVEPPPADLFDELLDTARTRARERRDHAKAGQRR